MKIIIILLLLSTVFVFSTADAYLSIPPSGSFKTIFAGGGNVTAQFSNSTLSLIGVGVTITPDYNLNRITFTASAGNGTFSSIYCNPGDFVNSLNATSGIGTCDTPVSGGGGENNTASNLSPGVGLFTTKSGVDLPFKSLAAGNNISLSSNATTVTISGTASGNVSSLNDASDVVLTSPAYHSIFVFDGTSWIDKLFQLNSKTCSGDDKVSGIDNVTGNVVCTEDKNSNDINSINADTTADQTIVGVSGNTTVGTSAGTHTVNLGSNVVVTNGAAQNINKAVTVTNAATTNAFKVDQNADSGASTSVGGALLVENTGNVGAGIIIYSNIGNTANGRLLNVRADNAAFDQSAVNIDYDGTANAMTITNAGTGTTNNALSISSTNKDDSTLGISGSQDTRGTFKITHTKPATDDASAAAISVALDGAGTAAQGIFIDSSGSTTGKLMNIRTGGVEKFVVKGNGQAEFFTGAITMNGTYLDMNTAKFAGSMGCSDGDKQEYDSTTDQWICVTISGGGNMTSLDGASDVVLTSPAYHSILSYDGLKWIDKVFRINTQTALNGNFITGIDNQTGAITTQTFKVFTTTCSGSDRVSAINNSTGTVTCSASGGGSPNALLDGSVHSDTAAQTPTRGSIIYADSTPKWNELVIGTNNKILKSDGTDISWGQLRALVARWDSSSTKTNIGTSFVDVYTQTNSNGKAVFIDTTGYTDVRMQIEWNKVGTGTQDCQLVDVASGTNVLVTHTVVSGNNDSGWDDIPAAMENAEKNYKLQCKSTTSTDDPVFEMAAIWLR